MHNLWLTFIDKEIELKYQINTQQYRRWSTFKLVTVGFMIVFLVKAVQALISKKILLFAQSLAIFIYLILQLILTKYKPQYLRFALVLTNHILTIFFIAYEDRDEDSQTAMLQGVNQMAATYLLILIGEFIDGAVTLVNLSLFRIIWAISFSSTLQLSAVVSSLLLILYINYFNYQFHRARRSQFLLTLVDSHWEEILKQLVQDKHYILLQFTEATLEFIFKSSNLCSPLFQDHQGFEHFLTQSTCLKLPLKTFIFEKIKKFTQDQTQTFRDSQIISFNRKLLNTDISIFLGNQPTILLVVKDFKSCILIDQSQVVKQQSQLIKLILSATNQLLHKIQHNHKKFERLIWFQRKIIIHHLIQEVRILTSKRTLLDLFQYLQKIAKYYQEKSFEWQILSLSFEAEVQTSPSILALLFFVIFEETKGNCLKITIEKKACVGEYKILINGCFSKQRILNLISELKIHFELILNEIIIKDSLIEIHLKQDIDLPFLFEI